MRRKPAVAGLFYSENPVELRRQIEASFLHKLGPGRLPRAQPSGPGETTAERVRAIIVPHAGYVYSGPIAAHAYAALSDSGVPDLAIVVGPNHSGLGSVADYCAQDFETPLGVAGNAAELSDALAGGVVAENPEAHAREHSVEVQLPFLQYLRPDLRIVPILIGLQDGETSREVGDAIVRAVRAVDRDVLLVASSDFTHAGPQYDQQPPRGTRVDRFAKEQDARAIEAIVRLHPGGLIDAVRRFDISSCGYGAVATVLMAARALGCRTVEHLAYATSHDIAPHHSCVGYASFVVR